MPIPKLFRCRDLEYDSRGFYWDSRERRRGCQGWVGVSIIPPSKVPH